MTTCPWVTHIVIKRPRMYSCMSSTRFTVQKSTPSNSFKYVYAGRAGGEEENEEFILSPRLQLINGPESVIGSGND